jgi:hypothetical protein
MAEFGERVARLFWNAGLQVETAWEIAVRLEGRGEAEGRKSRRFNRGLNIHAEQGLVEQNLKHRLGLNIAAGRPEKEEWLTILERHGWIRCKTGPLSRFSGGRMGWIAPRLGPP